MDFQWAGVPRSNLALDYCIASHRFYLEILALFCKSMILETVFILLAMQRLNKIKGCLCSEVKRPLAKRSFVCGSVT